LAAIAVLVAASSLASFGESYHALYLWASHHDFTGFWAAIWPLLIDTFIAVGELAVFVAMVDNWPLHHRLSAWLVTALGLTGSVAANIGHVATPDLATRATAAVPPLAAATSLWVGMGVLKRVVTGPVAAAVQSSAAVATEPPRCEQNSASISVQTKEPKATGGGTRTVVDDRGTCCSSGKTGSPSSNGRDGVTNAQGGSHEQSEGPTAIRAKTRERVKQVLTESPGMTSAELAKQTGASGRTITRARRDLARSRHSAEGSNHM
jgi:hypothetical protein